MIQKVRGTQDFLDLTLFNFIIATTKKYLETNHFTEIATPLLEQTDLFKRSLGLETDVVTKQMFTIATNSEESLSLRPEATASTMRAFLEHSVQAAPWKVFSWGPMFRYERPQKGRFRQFHQINIELINAASIFYDVYLIMLLDRLFSQTFELDNYALLINFLGCPEDRKAFKLLLADFLEKKQKDLCKTCLVRKEHNILRVLDCKNEQCQEQYKEAPHIDKHLCTICAQEWQEVQDSLKLLSITYSIDPMLVRGLDYYDKTAFEFVSGQLGAQSAFCGGGRYNHLAGQLGSKVEYPSLGASIGVERLTLLLEPLMNKLPLPQAKALHVVIPAGTKQQALALLVTDELQTNGLCTELLLGEGSLKSMLRKAHKMGAAYALIIGQEEQEAGVIAVKNMQEGIEERIAQAGLVKYLRH